MKRLGSAEMGVSSSRVEFAPLPPPVPLVEGGSGRAKGFGGPVAPAERSAEADGDGGGSTGPGVRPGSRIGVRMLLAVAIFLLSEDVSPPFPLSASSASSAGICTLSFGLARELERVGGI
jgi:hypothetical protein